MDGTSLVLAAVGALALAGRVGSTARQSADLLLPSELFHGTRHAFDRFVLDHEGRKDFGWLGRGIYLTDDEIIACSPICQDDGESLGSKERLAVDKDHIVAATAAERRRGG